MTKKLWHHQPHQPVVIHAKRDEPLDLEPPYPTYLKWALACMVAGVLIGLFVFTKLY